MSFEVTLLIREPRAEARVDQVRSLDQARDLSLIYETTFFVSAPMVSGSCWKKFWVSR
jgi:hypothetical protein